MQDNANIAFAFILTLVAGLSTGVGGLFTLFFKKNETKLLSVILGFSAGVMIYISFVEIFSEAQKFLIESSGKSKGTWLAMLAFFCGMLLIAIIDKLIPEHNNPHETQTVDKVTSRCGGDVHDIQSKKLLRTSMMSIIAIAVHNFPEGMATFAAAMKEPSLGIAIAFAIAIHNIPEGIAVAIPSYCASGNRSKAMLLSLAAGLSEPFGALIGYLILLPFLNTMIMGFLFSAVAGIMVYISLDELLPSAREYGEHHLSMYGLILGMIIIAVSLMVF